MGSTPLRQGLVASVRPDGVVAVDDALPVRVETGDEVESIVGEEAAPVKGLGDEVGDGLSGRLSLDLEVVDFELGLEDLDGCGGTLTSSLKSACMPEVAMMVLLVSCTNLVSLRVTREYPSDSLESPPTTTKS